MFCYGCLISLCVDLFCYGYVINILCLLVILLWNAQDCVTGLHDWRSQECNPATPIECVSLFFCTHPCVLVFITHMLCINRIMIGLVWWIWFNKVTFSYISFFKFANCFIALMNPGETCHLTGDAAWWQCYGRCCCYAAMIDCDRTQQHH